ncbi:chromosome partitioning protein ParB [Dyella lipolytica]|uniref:ParB N-terminal domain-containing protein n=1 Tax=Dyella lipolytica TaxID=1867835 RepID=A0ABW8ISU5_9GAMM|nr:plasmid partitioning protein RepB C-terminal domain-containing protein [Dyella lipolytica]GLQ46723.1 chromosome partitioning protein ParB [Dyella lipolytica]
MHTVTMNPTKHINVPNPRVRNRRIHQQMIDNIALVGLKRPITVTRSNEADSPTKFDLVCGQGRLEAYMQLSWPEIPAFVVDAKEDDCLLMGLVENIARRTPSARELMKAIETLRQRGYGESAIATKLGVTYSWVNMLTQLMNHGEERLVDAVELGLMPVALAVDISRSDEPGEQQALTDAYAQGLKGRKLSAVRKILQQRAQYGKATHKTGRKSVGQPRLTPSYLREIYRKEVEKQTLMKRKLDFTHSKVMFVVQALSTLREDKDFMDLVEKEGLNTLPLALSQRLNSGGAP